MYDIHAHLHTCIHIYIYSDVNNGGTRRDCLPQSFDWGDSNVDCPPKFKLRRDWAGSCLVRSHKEYIPSYNYFEAVIVTFQFPLYSMVICGVRRTRAPSLKHLKTLKSVILGNFH